ncbi:MAG TPA: hypothetical protein VHU84_19525, partial [Lacipirellulaceae bacterium]|nr:hypothetical protein [Lacipirellulaceae bacterium]
MTDSVAKIEKWFSGETEDGDFYRDRLIRYEIISPGPACDQIFYCTKRSVAFESIDDDPGGFRPGIIARGGLPCEEDIAWLGSFTEGRQLQFVGDLDPADLMIYAWLRLKLLPIQVIHHAINDRFITDHG